MSNSPTMMNTSTKQSHTLDSPNTKFHNSKSAERISEHTNPSQTFHPFPRLPIELRELIWSYTLPGPRLIEVYAKEFIITTSTPLSEYTHSPNNHPFIKPGSFCAANPHRTPILYATGESRRVAFRFFSYCLPMPYLKNPGILFQPAIDTIYFRSENQRDLKTHIQNADIPKLGMEKIRSFAFDDWGENSNGYREGPDNFCPFLFQGPDPILCSVEELFLIQIRPWHHMTPLELEVDKCKWHDLIRSTLKDLKSGLNPEFMIVSKPKLWDGLGESGWDDTPFWMAKGKRDVWSLNMANRRHVLGERERLPLYPREEEGR